MYSKLGRNMHKKLPLVLKASAIFVAITLTGCGGDTVEENFANSVKYSQQKDHKSSALALKKILMEQPDNVKARKMLAAANIALGKFRDAEKNIEPLVKPKVQTPEVLATMAEIKFELKKYAEVYMLAYKDFGTNKEFELKTKFYAAMSSIQDNKKSKVEEFIVGMGAIDKTSYYTLVAQAWAAFALGETGDARELVDLALASNATFNQALFLSARLFDVEGRVSEAKESYQEYVDLFPYDIDKKIYLYQTLMTLGEVKKAETLVESIYIIHPKNPLVNLYKAQIHYQKGEYERSREFSRNVLNGIESHMPAQLIAGASSYKLGDYKQAYSYLKAYEDKLSTGSVKQMILLTKLKLGLVSEVADDILKSDDSHIDIDILMVASMNLSRTGQQEKAIALLELSGGGDNAKILAQQGLTRLSMNDLSGIALLEKSIEMDQELEGAKLALAMAYLRDGNVTAAVAIAKQWQNNDKTKILGQLLNANIYKQQGKHDLAKSVFKDILKTNKDNVAAMFALARYSESEGEYANALIKYTEIVQLYPGHVDALSRITEINKSDGNISSTLELLNPLLAKNMDNVKLRLNVAYNQFLNGDIQDTISTLSEIEPNSQTPDVYWIVLGDSYMQEGLVGSGIKAFQALVKKNPTNLLGQLRYISSLELGKRYSGALHATKNAKTVFKGNKAIDLLEVRYLLKNNSGDEALAVIDTFKNKYGVTSEILSYEAESHMINNDFEKSAAIYLMAYKVTPLKDYKLGSAKALIKAGKAQESSEILEGLYKSADKNEKLGLALMLGEVYYGLDYQKSYDYFKEVLTSKPKDIIVNNNLAMVSIELGEFEDALRYSEVSYRENSGHTSILNTYGTALVKNRMYEKAVFILEDSIQKGSNNVPAMINLAVAYDKLGKFANEIKLLERAMELATDPDDKREIALMGARL